MLPTHALIAIRVVLYLNRAFGMYKETILFQPLEYLHIFLVKLKF